MNLVQAIILGIIQGITEWLPISSSGHLVITQKLFGLEVPLVFDVILHFGTLLVIIVVFRKDILQIINALLKTPTMKLDEIKQDANILMAWFILIGSIPIALAGYFLRDFIEKAFNSFLVVGIALIITGGLLWLSKYKEKKKTINQMKWYDALFIGVFQAFALLPGISRSGSTISAALFRKVERETAARYSFLLVIPAIVGATLFEMPALFDGTITNYFPLIVGTLVTIIVGYFSLKWLLKVIKKGKFHYFAIYCWIVGFLVLASSLLQ